VVSRSADPKRAVVYIDGFNFYYGAIRGGPNKWLDVEKLFRLLRPHDDIQFVRYFTALVGGRSRARQEEYLKALDTLPKVEVLLGRFKAKRIKCNVSGCSYSGDRFFVGREEKRTDVNIAVTMVEDAFKDVCDRFIVVSGDSDLVPAVNLIKRRFPKKEVIVYVPARSAVRGAATELRGAADKDRMLPLLPKCRLPASIPDGAGDVIQKPTDW